MWFLWPPFYDEMMITGAMRYVKENVKMTREETLHTLRPIFKNCTDKIIYEFIDALEALGLLKFEEEKPVRKLCSAEQGGNHGFNFRVEEWGDDKYVLWHDGQIVWRSWKS